MTEKPLILAVLIEAEHVRARDADTIVAEVVHYGEAMIRRVAGRHLALPGIGNVVKVGEGQG